MAFLSLRRSLAAAAVLVVASGLVVPQSPSRIAGFSQAPRFSRLSTVVAKKGKPDVPIQFRGAANQREQMRDYMEQQEQNANTDDGVPVFNLFVRSKKAGIWYPCGSLKGDSKSQALTNAYQGKFLRNVYKGQLDKGVARSIFENEKRLTGQVLRSYPQLKQSKGSLDFGYKLEVKGIEETVGKQEVTVVDRSMLKGWLDNVKGTLGME